MVPEDQGGLGLATQDTVLLAEACGNAALPEALITHIGVTLPLLAQLQQSTAKSALRDALDSQSYIALHDHNRALARDAQSAKYGVSIIDNAITVARIDEVTLHSHASIDPLRRLSSLTISESGEEAAHLIALARERASVFTAAKLLGLGQRAIDIASAYAKERQQFGKPIGANQAVKHLLANAQVKIEFARPVVYAAAAVADHLSTLTKSRVSHAKLASAEAALNATRAALQVHGAIGYSWEADVHIFLKRSLALAEEWGTRPTHRARVQACQTNLPFAPDTLFAMEI